MNDDMAFATIMKGVEARINGKVISYIYRAMRIDDEDVDGYYILQFINALYTLQEDRYMKGYEPPIKAYVGEIVCDDIF